MTTENVAAMLRELIGAIILVLSLLQNWGAVVSSSVKHILHASGSPLLIPRAFQSFEMGNKAVECMMVLCIG